MKFTPTCPVVRVKDSHIPPEQPPGTQLRPQLPQCAGFEETSTHSPAHDFCPPSQALGASTDPSAAESLEGPSAQDIELSPLLSFGASRVTSAVSPPSLGPLPHRQDPNPLPSLLQI